MRRRQIKCILLILCMVLWISRHVEIPARHDVIDKDRESFLKGIRQFYSNFTPNSKLSALEDAKFDKQTGEIVAYLRTFEDPHFLSVPTYWCLNYNRTFTYANRQVHPRRLFESLLKAVRDSCFEDRDPNAQDRMKVRESLRLLRNSFEESNLPLIMTSDSMLGSLRYHRRMFYDSNYDFLVDERDMERAVSILSKLSANASNEMRLIDARSSFGNPKVGLLCGNDPGWRKRAKGCIEMEESYVVCNSKALTENVLAPCLLYIDFYWMKLYKNHRLRVQAKKPDFAVEDVINSDYRPLDGTLFRSVRNFERYAEVIYGSPIQICVPKIRSLIKNQELSVLTGKKDLDCRDFALSFEYAERHRSHSHILMDGEKRIELGLHWLEYGECVAYSLFVKFE
ncbi:unnamed protein product [Dibothriocephalus latus]|uniref:Uncharacterized protein n=1 Tax=Dibothriocephalus latus TaxID=60516 RepID=A0A3P7P6Z4_DIBLA|nr:unnamed protein product [Dibothriocephalus latus]